jgi:hypothetical protein
MINLILAFAVSLVFVVLGFIALLKQKTYLDNNTRQPVEVDVPVLGKVKTNYPAIVFVVLGFALAFTAFEKTFPARKTEWRILGTLKHPSNQRVDWPAGTLALVPTEMRVSLSPQGRFEISALVEEGKSIEDVYETLDFSHTIGSAQINLKNEIQRHKKGNGNVISSVTDHTRTFKPIDITLYP